MNVKTIDVVGDSVGEICGRNGCKGIISEHESERGCSCHINPPCSYCTDDRAYCPECGWEGREEQLAAEKSQPPQKPFEWKRRTIKDLDNTKIDWIYEPHTHFSMIKVGVYPEGTTMEQVREVVKGTFGGRFEYFENGKFKYIAYTD